MYYTNLFISLLLITCLSACSGNTEQKNNNVSTSTQNKESLKVELALYKQAILALNEKKLDQAEKLFIKMSELQPDIAGPWANLALISIKKTTLNKHSNTLIRHYRKTLLCHRL